jgi:hypothetical protein
MESEPKSPDEIEVDRLLGNLALVKLSALKPMGGPSEPTLYRARREGKIKFVKNGKNNALTRATAKRILLEGLGEVSFKYGKQAAQRTGKSGEHRLTRARLALAGKRKRDESNHEVA